MINIEDISMKISTTISRELNFDKEKTAVINYGIFASMQMVISILIVSFFGLIFNVVLEALIILLIVSILRQQSGGVHATSPEICTFIGTVFSVGMAVVINNINLSLLLVSFLGVVTFICAFYIVYKLAPVDSLAKPIKTEKKRKRLKKSSILILSVYLIIVVMNIVGYCVTKKYNLLVYSGCIYMGLVWQIFSLTKTGYLILGKLDALFK